MNLQKVKWWAKIAALVFIFAFIIWLGIGGLGLSRLIEAVVSLGLLLLICAMYWAEIKLMVAVGGSILIALLWIALALAILWGFVALIHFFWNNS